MLSFRKKILLQTTFFLCLSGPLFPATFDFGDNVRIDRPVTDDLYLAASELEITSPLRGSLWAAAGTVRIRDRSAQDLVLTGGDIYVYADVGDDLILVSSEAEIRGHVHGDVLFGGGRLTLTRDAVIDGDLIAVGGTVRVYGKVGRNIVARARSVEISGEVGRELRVRSRNLEIRNKILGKSEIGTDTLQLSEGARFYSRVRYYSVLNDPDFSGFLAPGASVEKDPTLEKSREEALLAEKATPLFSAVFGWPGLLMSVGAATVMIIHYMLLFPAVFRGAGRYLALAPVTAAGSGILFFLLLPVLAMILFLTVIGIPAGILTLVIYFSVIAVGRSLSSTVLSIALMRKFHIQPDVIRTVFWATVLNTILTLLVYIPFLGWAILWLVFLMGAGAIFRTIFRETDFAPSGANRNGNDSR